MGSQEPPPGQATNISLWEISSQKLDPMRTSWDNKSMIKLFFSLLFFSYAASADDGVKELAAANAADQEAIYKLSSQVLGEVKGKNSESLQKTFIKAQGDPEKLLQSLSPELQKKIRELAGRVEERQK